MTGRIYDLQRHGISLAATESYPCGEAAAVGQTCLASVPPTAQGASGATGLSKHQNRTCTTRIPETRRVTVFHGAGLLLLESRKTIEPGDEVESVQSKRGKINSWSAKSRMNCRRLLHSLNREALQHSWFLTVTYPAVFPAPDDHAVYKGHLHRLCQELRRRHQQISGVWKLEFQTRRAAHFHFLLIGCPENLDTFRQWIGKTWARIVGSGDPNHELAGTNVESIRTFGGVMAYVTSYISKEDQTLPGNFTGRYWGVVNRRHLPVVESTEYEIPDSAAVRINRWLRTLSRKYQEESRWKAWAKIRKDIPGNYHWMSRLEFETAWSRRRKPAHPFFFNLWLPGGFMLVPWHALLPALHNGSLFRPPRRVRQRNNSGGTLLCQATTFWSAIERAFERGLLPGNRMEDTRMKRTAWERSAGGFGAARGQAAAVRTVPACGNGSRQSGVWWADKTERSAEAGAAGRCGVSPLEGVAAHGVAARGRPSPPDEAH